MDRVTPAEQAAALSKLHGGPVAAARACGMSYESFWNVASGRSRCGNPQPREKTLLRLGLNPRDCEDGRYAVRCPVQVAPSAVMLSLRKWRAPLTAAEIAEDYTTRANRHIVAAAAHSLRELERAGMVRRVQVRGKPYWCAA